MTVIPTRPAFPDTPNGTRAAAIHTAGLTTRDDVLRGLGLLLASIEEHRSQVPDDVYRWAQLAAAGAARRRRPQTEPGQP